MQHPYARLYRQVSLVALAAIGFCAQAAAQTVSQDVSPSSGAAVTESVPDSSRPSSRILISHPKPSGIVNDLFATYNYVANC